MDALERKIVHDAVAGVDGVDESQGEEPDRSWSYSPSRRRIPRQATHPTASIHRPTARRYDVSRET